MGELERPDQHLEEILKGLNGLSKQEKQYLRMLWFGDRSAFWLTLQRLKNSHSLHLEALEYGCQVADQVYQELQSDNPLRRANAKWWYLNWQQRSVQIVNTYPWGR